jgi:rfaE bifunctional protein nucleotidyltransferase chain/domain
LGYPNGNACVTWFAFFIFDSKATKNGRYCETMITRASHIRGKIVDLSSGVKRANIWKMMSDKIVFTNGCFDLLHEGHVSYLAEAADLGNRLIVGLNSDDSVRRQGKGDDRPINAEGSRALVLASLGFVDMVVLFDEDTPIELIQNLKPDVLVKGADYDKNETDPTSPKYIVGSSEVKSYGGEVESIPLIEGFSTTGLIHKMKKDS